MWPRWRKKRSVYDKGRSRSSSSRSGGGGGSM